MLFRRNVGQGRSPQSTRASAPRDYMFWTVWTIWIPMNRTALLFLQSAALAALVWIGYHGSLHNPFVFDDWHVIPQNPAVRELADIPRFFSDPTAFSILSGNQDYRPIFSSSMALCWSIGNGTTLPFHVVSILIHFLNCVWVLLILRYALDKDNGHIGGLRGASAHWAAFLAAVLFAVHPLNSESVLYISSQSVLWTACFYLLGFLCYIHAFRRVRSPSRVRAASLFVGSVACYGVALLSKPIAITLPIVLVLWKLTCGGWNRPSWRSYAWVIRWVPFGVLSVAYIALRGRLLPAAIGPSEPVRPYFEHYLTETKAIVFYYLKLALLPFGQNADPEFAVSDSFRDPWVIASVAILLLVAVILIRFRANRVLLFWSLWFPVGLVVTSYATVLGQIVNEHRVYLSMVGFSSVAGLLVLHLWTKARSSAGRLGLALGVAGVWVALSYGTVIRSEIWSSQLTLWENSASHGGTWRAHMNYALALDDAGRPEEALREFQEAVRLGPYAWAHINLGHAYVRRGELETGLDHLRTAVRLWPDLPEAHLFLGYGLEQAGRPSEAEREMKYAIELRGNYLKAYEFLGSFYEGQNDLASAIQVYRSMGELDSHQEWIGNRIRLLEARLTDTERVRDLFGLAFEQQQKGDREEAIRSYEALLELEPQHRQGTFNLAYAYRDGDSPVSWRRSAALFETVLDLDSGYTEARHHLATVQWKLDLVDEALESDRLYLEEGEHEDLKARSRRRIESSGSR